MASSLTGLAAGLRISEVAGLAMHDLNPSTGALNVRRGKGGKSRQVFVKNGGLIALQDWLAVRGLEPGPLFVSVNKGGKLVRHHGALVGIGTSSIGRLLEDRRRAARIPAITWHDLRRTCAGDLLEVTDVSTASRILGHASMATTQRYDRRPEQLKETAAETVQVPYKRRLKKRLPKAG